MKADQIQLEKRGFHFSANAMPARSHYKSEMVAGKVFPATKAQAIHFTKNEFFLDLLNSKDVQKVEAVLRKHGFEGEYKMTKSGKWVRLKNHEDLHAALKKEFSI